MKLIIPNGTNDPTSTPFEVKPQLEYLRKPTGVAGLPKNKLVGAAYTFHALKPMQGLTCDVPGCRKYGKTFANEHALAEHRRAVHPAAEPAKEQTSKEPEQTEEPKPLMTTATEFKCDQCQRTFKTELSLKHHTRQAHQPVENPVAECLLCKRHFATINSARVHASTLHQGNKDALRWLKPQELKPPTRAPYPCPACAYGAESREQLSRHWGKNHHPEPLCVASDRFQCTECGATSQDRKAALNHATRVHQSGPATIADRTQFTPKPAPTSAGTFHCRGLCDVGETGFTGSLEASLKVAERLLKSGFAAKVEIEVVK